MNIPRLDEIRRDLRSRMAISPICDAEKLTRDVEAAYRKMWQNWYAKPVAES